MLALAYASGQLSDGRGRCRPGSCPEDPSTCKRCPTVAEPIDTGDPCSKCDGKPGNKDCPECRGWGTRVIVGCPLNSIHPVAWEVFAAADLAKHGSWPVSGGWLDQVDGLRRAVRLVWAEEERVKAERLAGD